MPRTFDCRFELLGRAGRRAAALCLVATPIGCSRTRSMWDDFAIRARSTTVCTQQSSTKRFGIASNINLQRKRKRGRFPAEMPSSFPLASSTTIGAIGWAQAMPPRADGVGATMCRGPSLKVVTQTPDRPRASRQRKSRSRYSMRLKTSSRPDARSMDLARCLTSVFPGGQSARSAPWVSHAQSSPFTRRCSTRSNESQSPRRKSRYG